MVFYLTLHDNILLMELFTLTFHKQAENKDFIIILSEKICKFHPKENSFMFGMVIHIYKN